MGRGHPHEAIIGVEVFGEVRLFVSIRGRNVRVESCRRVRRPLLRVRRLLPVHSSRVGMGSGLLCRAPFLLGDAFQSSLTSFAGRFSVIVILGEQGAAPLVVSCCSGKPAWSESGAGWAIMTAPR